MIKDYFILASREIQRRKIRTWLTMIGIIIGIATVSSLITLGQGMENAITGQFESLGKDKLFISAKGSSLSAGLSIDAIKITDKDIEIVDGVSGVKNTAGMIYTSGRFEYNDQVRYNLISGVPLDIEKRKLIGESMSFKIKEGRPLNKGDSNKVILGHSYYEENKFGKTIGLGDKILLQEKSFKVIGFLEKIGSPPDDNSAMIPLDVYQDLFDKKDEVGMIVAQIQPGEDIDVVSERIKKELRDSRNLDEGKEDFSIETPGQIASAFADILNIIQIVFIGIAAISLFVGGIGIMNTMFTTVLQRTKEIGILKAIGAKDKDILILVMIESGFYGLGGGIIGVIIGVGFAKIAELIFIRMVGPALLSIEINFILIISTIIFSFIIGCISGVLPALKASKSDPVLNLRYE